MPSRTLTTVWGVLDTFLLVAGVISIVFSEVWRSPDVLLGFILKDINLDMGLVLGIMFLITFLASLFAITQRKPLTTGMKVLNSLLVVDSLAVLVIGSIIWFYSLREPTNYNKVWLATPSTSQIQLQDQFQCCGYNNGTSIAVGGSFCADSNTASTQIGCMTALTHAADYTINNIFTSIYGFMAITLSLIMASLCHINKRIEEDRFRRIDEKRGGKGFV